MPPTKELANLRELLHSTLVEIEMALDSATYPDWAETKEKVVRALDIIRKLEREQMWAALSKKK